MAHTILSYLLGVLMGLLGVDDNTCLFQKNTLDINDPTTIKILYDKKLLSQNQLESYQAYHKKHHHIDSINQLIILPHWNAQTIKKIRPFIESPTSPKSQDTSTKKIQYKVTIQNKAKKTKGKTERNTTLQTYCYTHYATPPKKPLQFTFTAIKKKDESPTYAQAYSNLTYQTPTPTNILQQVIIGEYKINKQGHGAIIDPRDKASLTSYFNKRPTAIAPSQTKERNKSHNGGAITLQKGPWNILFYTANNQCHASLHTKKGTTPHIETLTGKKAYKDKKEYQEATQCKEQLIGSTLTYQVSNNTHIGIQYLDQSYTQLIQQKKGFQGKQNSNASIFITHEKNQTQTIAEVATTQKQALSLLVGKKITFSKNHQTLFVAQYFSDTYHALHSKSTGGGKQPSQPIRLGIQSQNNFTKLKLTQTLEASLLDSKDKTAPQQEIKLTYQLKATYKPTQLPPITTTIKLTHQASKDYNLNTTIETKKCYGKATFNSTLSLKNLKEPTFTQKITYKQGHSTYTINGCLNLLQLTLHGSLSFTFHLFHHYDITLKFIWKNATATFDCECYYKEN